MRLRSVSVKGVPYGSTDFRWAACYMTETSLLGSWGAKATPFWCCVKGSTCVRAQVPAARLGVCAAVKAFGPDGCWTDTQQAYNHSACLSISESFSLAPHCRLEEYEGTGREALAAFDARLDKAAAVLRQAGCATPGPASPGFRKPKATREFRATVAATTAVATNCCCRQKLAAADPSPFLCCSGPSPNPRVAGRRAKLSLSATLSLYDRHQGVIAGSGMRRCRGAAPRPTCWPSRARRATRRQRCVVGASRTVASGMAESAMAPWRPRSSGARAGRGLHSLLVANLRGPCTGVHTASLMCCTLWMQTLGLRSPGGTPQGISTKQILLGRPHHTGIMPGNTRLLSAVAITLARLGYQPW